MDAETLREMGKRHYPLQHLRVIFDSGLDGIRALSVLNSFANQGLVVFNEPIMVSAILFSKSWGRNFEGRRVLEMRFPGGQLWNECDFHGVAHKGIENIQISSSSPLNALQTSRQKKFDEAYAKIVKQVVSRTLKLDIAYFGLALNVFPITVRNFRTIAIVVENNGRPAFSLFLDGWSGIIRNKEGQAICFCGSLKTAEDEVGKALYDYLEKATA